MGFIVETPPVLRHECKLPPTCYEDKNGTYQPSHAHLTIWQCDDCKKYYVYKDKNYYTCFYPLLNEWKGISEKRAMKLKYKWEAKEK